MILTCFALGSRVSSLTAIGACVAYLPGDDSAQGELVRPDVHG